MEEEGGNAVAKEEMVSKFLFGELDIVLCCKSKKTVDFAVETAKRERGREDGGDWGYYTRSVGEWAG